MFYFAQDKDISTCPCLQFLAILNQEYYWSRANFVIFYAFQYRLLAYNMEMYMYLVVTQDPSLNYSLSAPLTNIPENSGLSTQNPPPLSLTVNFAFKSLSFQIVFAC